MRILLLVLVLSAVAVASWLYVRWAQTDTTSKNNRDDAEHYASLLNLYAQDCARHLDAAQNPERSWKERMERLNHAEEAKRKHAETLVEAPTDMRGQDLESPPSANLQSLRRELFNARKGDPDLPWSLLQNHEQSAHAWALERAAAQLRSYGDTESAEELEALTEDIYRDLIRRTPKRTTPFLRLIALYRRQNDIDKETEVLRRALEQSTFDSEEQREDFQDRLEQLRELRGA